MSDDDAEFDRVPYENGDPADHRFHTWLSIQQEMLRLVSGTKEFYKKKDRKIMQGELRVLLQAHKWNMRDLLAKQSRKSVTEMLKEARLDLDRPFDRVQTLHYQPCVSCKQLAPHIQVAGLSCGHLACGECWKAHFSKLFERAHKITCLECDLVLSDERVDQFVYMTPFVPQFRLQFHAWQVNVYIKENKMIKCPKPGCLQYVKLLGNPRQVRKLRCNKCHTVITTNRCCMKKWHGPIPCELWEMWHKYKPDTEILTDPLANYKKCPHCRAPFELVGGCLQMRCRWCKTEFCYECLGSWEVGHPNRECNRSLFAHETVSLEEKNLFRDHLFGITHEKCERYQSEDFKNQIRNQCAANLQVLRKHDVQFEDDFFHLARYRMIVNGDALTRLRIFYFFIKFKEEKNIANFQEHLSRLENSWVTLAELLQVNLEEFEEVKQIRKWRNDVCEAGRAANEIYQASRDLAQREAAARSFRFRVRFLYPMRATSLI